MEHFEINIIIDVECMSAHNCMATDEIINWTDILTGMQIILSATPALRSFTMFLMRLHLEA